MFLPSLVCLTWSSDWYSSSLRPGTTWFHNSLQLTEEPQPPKVIYYALGHGKPAVPQILVKGKKPRFPNTRQPPLSRSEDRLRIQQVIRSERCDLRVTDQAGFSRLLKKCTFGHVLHHLSPLAKPALSNDCTFGCLRGALAIVAWSR